MSVPVYFRQTILAILLLTSTFAFAQTTTEKIKAKWTIERFEAEKNTPQAIKAKRETEGLSFTFGEGELLISKKTGDCETVIKKGPYLVSGNTLTLGKDEGEILLLSEKELTIKVPGHYVLYLIKM